MAKKIKFTKNTFKKIGAVLLAGALGIGAIFGIAKLGEVLDTETKTIYPTYSVGGLKTTDGKYTETSDSIYTKEAFECQGLKITPAFDSNVSYEVFFYDSNEQFLSSSGSKTDFYESDNILAQYARIQIKPLEDDKVSWYETSKYANQLKVEVNKVQALEISDNLCSVDESVQLKYYGENLNVFVEQDNVCCSELINVVDYEQIYVYVPSALVTQNVILQFFDSNGVNLNYPIQSKNQSDDNRYLIVDIPNNATYFSLVMPLSYENLYKFYCVK